MAKQVELLDLQKSARAFYENKKYAEALDTFSKAVVLAQKWSPSDVPSILDQRVGVYVKLGNLDLARKDAMRIIRSNKADGRGYLRCGQLDRLEENPSTAIRWYDHGLKHVPATDPLRSTLDVQRGKTKILLDRKLMASNARDPVSILPAELIQYIALYLAYQEVVKVLRVCKSWKGTFSMQKPLIDSIDFSGAKCEINYKMMVAGLKRLGSNSKRLILKANVAESAEVLLWKHLERWHNYTQLEELTIAPRSFHNVWPLLGKFKLKHLDLQFGLESPEVVYIGSILTECIFLEVARFSNLYNVHYCQKGMERLSLCPTLRILHLVGGSSGLRMSQQDQAQINIEFLECFSHLEELKCRDLAIIRLYPPFDLSLSNLRHLRNLSFVSCSLPEWPRLPPSIEVWENHSTITLERSRPLPTSLGNLPKLSLLRFYKTSAPPPLSAYLPSKSTSSLDSLDLRGTPSSTLLANTTSKEDMLKQLSKLREFACDGNLEEQTMLFLCRGENLEVISLLASPIHGADLIELLKRPDNRIRQITLTDCENVSPDTIDWARSRGVTMRVRSDQALSTSSRRAEW